MDVEVWRAMVGFEDWYDVSDWGRVRSWRKAGPVQTGRRAEPRILQGRPDSDGYRKVCLGPRNNPTESPVHRLVLDAFVGPCPTGMVCRHFPDRDPSNNRLDNLQWGTPKENSADMLVHGTRRFGDASPSRMNPQTLARGAQNGSYTKPERRPRGARNGAFTKPHRVRRGADNGRAKLTEEKAQYVLDSHKTGAELVRELGVSSALISFIRSGKLWAHLKRSSH